MASISPPQLYAKHLLSFGYGYPLWMPEPSHELLQLRQDGLRIGDVGVIDLENGCFDVFFNICLPRDHPLHRATRVPDGFMHIELDECDIASLPHAVHPGKVISTSSVTTSAQGPSGTATSRPVTYEFSLSSGEGALLILPKGATSHKLRKRQLFKDVAAQNAVHWYDFVQQHLGRTITHDSLYLITGLYKTDSWSVASFHQATGTAESSAQFKASMVGEDSKMTYTWETTRALDWRVGPQIDVGFPNQSVFISGFKIAIREGVLGKKRVEVEVDTSPSRSRLKRFFGSGNGQTSLRPKNIWRRFISRGGSGRGSKSAEQALPTVAVNSLKEQRVPFSFPSQTTSDNKCDPRHAEIHPEPPPILSLHPSDVVNRYLLNKEPSVNVAITHDSQWSDLLEKGALTREDLEDDRWLESTDYRIISYEGAAYIRTVGDSSIQLTGIDSAALEAWEKEVLDDAEEILSRQLIRHTDSDHLTLAHRALIRARLHRWDASLRDAGTSIDIQPSVIAHVTKGIALFGQNKYDVAIAAFDVALRQCDLFDRDMVLLIKFIALFDFGYHAESMTGIAELIAHCSIGVMPACSSVQAEMCVRFAQNEDHDKGLQLLTRALLLVPLNAVPELAAISLICGWKFDNIFFTICRRRCDLLRDAGRTSEAVQSFQTMMRDLGEDAKTRNENAKWIATFTQQYPQVLESLGGHEMTPKDHVEATTSHLMASTMGQATQEDFLMKLSEADAAAQGWDNALKNADDKITQLEETVRLQQQKVDSAYGLARILVTYQQKHQCEALLAEGRVLDAIQQYFKIKKAFSDDVNYDPIIQDWLSDFARKCIVSLENIGDLASQNEKHSKALVAYSTALSLDPSISDSLLIKWASIMLLNSSTHEVLDKATVKFKFPRFSIYRTLCDILEGKNRIAEAIECFRQMRNELIVDTSSYDERANWERGFQQRCLEKLDEFADVATKTQNYVEAAQHFSTILLLDPSNRMDTLIKRSETLAMMGSWEEAMNDADEWAKKVLERNSIDKDINTAAMSKLPMYIIYRAICDALERGDRITEAIRYFQQMETDVAADTNAQNGRADWELGFKWRCLRKLEELSRVAMDSENYSEAIAHFSTILSVGPLDRIDTLTKRCKARLMMNLCEDALQDADEIIRLDKSSYYGYQLRHAALHGAGRYADAVKAFHMMLSKIQKSSDKPVRKLRSQYVDATPKIKHIIATTIAHMPRIVIDTTTGRLHEKTQLAKVFEAHPIFPELVSSMTTCIDEERIRKAVKLFYRYVMLSHKWEPNEPCHDDVKHSTVYELQVANTKVQTFCSLVRALGFRWAWSDTICIDRGNSVVLQESLASMFSWYRGSSLTLVYLRGVSSQSNEPGGLRRSVWNTRVWTYQEYVAADTVLFYTEDWQPYLGLALENHKKSPVVISEMEQATSVSAEHFAVLRPGLSRAREKLYLASARQTTLVEDIAYSLLGIFDVAIPIIYGEGLRAVGRLLEHVISGSGDATILAWTGDANAYNSCLPADMSVYGDIVSPHIPQLMETAEVDKIVSDLRASLPDLSDAGTLYVRLNEVPAPSLVARRLRLPGIICPVFNLACTSGPDTKTGLYVFHATTKPFGDIEIKTTSDLTLNLDLHLVHPWIRPLLDQEFSRGVVGVDETVKALRMVARLKQPFGALLFAQVVRTNYKRVASDSLIMAQVRENVSLSDLMYNIRTIDVQ